MGVVASTVLLGSTLSSVATAAPGASAPAKSRVAAVGGKVARTVPRATALSGAALELASRTPGTAKPVVVAHLDPALNRLAGVAGAAATAGAIALQRDGAVEVSVSGAAAVAAATSVGARVIARFGGTVTVAVQPARLRALAAHAGVSQVRRAVRAIPQVTSQGVSTTGAQRWAANGDVGHGGAGIKIGIVDAGFGDLQAEIGAGNFGDPANVVYPGGQNHCYNDALTPHGTAVSEIVHQMAPKATLYLYCVDDNTGFAQSADQVVAAGVKIVNSSLAFTGDSRGDGFAAAGTTERAVKTAREAGVLWVQAAGNAASDHWSGSLADSNRDGFVDLNGTATRWDDTVLDPGTSGFVALTWDQWPVSSLGITLQITQYDYDSSSTTPIRTNSYTQQAGTDPEMVIGIANSTTGQRIEYDVAIKVNAGTPAYHYDLSYGGEVYGSYLAYQYPARGAAGSMLEPATSPWALAVGAEYWQTGALESFSSRGPTIDGRIKPDLLAPDGVATNVTEEMSTGANPGFYGTSAAAPHVAGAAALVLGANPAMDASDLQAFLQRRASPLADPPTDAAGHGTLQLGDPLDPSGIQPVPGSGYVALTAPARILDTRSGLGGRNGAMVAGTVIAVKLPSTVPVDAKSVVLNVTGINAKGTTYLAVYADAFSGSTNLTLTSTDPSASVAAVVRMNSAHGFKLLNRLANTDAVVDVVGYFAAPTAADTLGYAPVPPTRLFDTRYGTGAAKAKLTPNQVIRVAVAGTAPVPPGATAAVVNLTAIDETAPGYLMAYPNSPGGTSSLDYRSYARSNLAIVGLAADGSFKLQNRLADTDAIIDVVGYLSASAPGKFVTLPAPLGVVDTRNGKGGRLGALSADASIAVDGGGRYEVPYAATAVWAGYDALGGRGTGYLTAYAGDADVPHTSNLNYSTGRSVANAVIANLAPPSALSQYKTINRVAATHLTQDLFGYFVNPAG